MTTSDSAKPDSPYLKVPRHFTSISRPKWVPSVSWDGIGRKRSPYLMVGRGTRGGDAQGST